MAMIRLFLNVDEAVDDHQRLVFQMANLCSGLFREAGSHIAFSYTPAQIAVLGDTAKTGVLAVAVELRNLLCQIPDGRKACSDLGFQQVFENVEGKCHARL